MCVSWREAVAKNLLAFCTLFVRYGRHHDTGGPCLGTSRIIFCIKVIVVFEDVQENGWVVRKQICLVCPIRKSVGRFLHVVPQCLRNLHEGEICLN